MSAGALDSTRHDHCKQAILDYLRDNIDHGYGVDELAAATGLSEDEAKIAVEALAYANEVFKEHTEGGLTVYRRKP